MGRISSIVEISVISISLFDVRGMRRRGRAGSSSGIEHLLDPGAVRREELLLDAADRQHAAAQRDLAGHRHVAAHRRSRAAATPRP